jgi:hypothetical protein
MVRCKRCGLKIIAPKQLNVEMCTRCEDAQTCRGSYYMFEVETYDLNGLQARDIDYSLVEEKSCKAGDCFECDRMRLVMELNLCDSSLRTMMEEIVDGGVYKLEYEEYPECQHFDNHLAHLIQVK